MTIATDFSGRNQRAFRGLSALALVIGHMLIAPVYDMGFASPDHVPWLSQLLLFYFLVVEGFLLLSGCLLTLSYWDHFTKETPAREMDRFYVRRLARIYPLHLFATALIGLFALLGVAHPVSSGLERAIFAQWEWTGLLNLLLMQGWGIFPVASWNEPAWTLSILFLLYVMFPNLVMGMRRLPQSPVLYALAAPGVLIGYTIFRQVVDVGGHSDGAGGIARGLVFFICGMCLARIHQLGWAAGRNWDCLFGLSLLALPVCIFLWYQLGPFDLLPMHLILAFMMLCLLRADGCISRLFSNRVSLWLGTISFALYLLHYPLSLLVTHFMGDWLAGLPLPVAYGLGIGVLIGGSALGYYAVERPMARVTKRWLK